MSINSKLFISLLISSLIATTGMLLMMRWNLATGMDHFQVAKQQQQHQPLLDALGHFYDEKGSWVLTRADARQLGSLFQSNLPTNGPETPHHPARPGPNFHQPFSRRPLPRDLRLLDMTGKPVLSEKGPPLLDNKAWVDFPIYSQIAPHAQVGWLSLRKQPAITEAYEQVLFEYLQSTLWQSALGVLILAGLLATFLSRHFLGPLRNLTHRISLLARGDYTADTQTTSKRVDELGKLGLDIEDLRASLANTDAARKRWLADTSHELRTPLAIARAELEAIQDGVHAFNGENLNTVHEEILHLQRLIEDLSLLANSDLGNFHYQKSPLNFSTLCQHCVDQSQRLAQTSGLTLTAHIAPNCWIWGDSTRLEQMLKNLINNSIKYTDSPGLIELTLHTKLDKLYLTLEDSEPGVSAEHLPLLFNYLFRVETSRNRKSGGSGLGLSIAQRIAQAHEAEITATASSKGGLKLTFTSSGIEGQG